MNDEDTSSLELRKQLGKHLPRSSDSQNIVRAAQLLGHCHIMPMTQTPALAWSRFHSVSLTSC